MSTVRSPNETYQTDLPLQMSKKAVFKDACRQESRRTGETAESAPPTRYKRMVRTLSLNSHFGLGCAPTTSYDILSITVVSGLYLAYWPFALQKASKNVAIF